MRQIAKIKIAELRAPDSISGELRRLISDSIQILEQSSSNEAIQFRLDWLVNIVARYIDQIPAGEAVLSLVSRTRALSGEPQAAQAYSLYFVWNFGSELFIRLCMGIYQIFQNSRICAEMLK